MPIGVVILTYTHHTTGKGFIMTNEYFTKDIATILDVSVPTVRNYAKKLEQYNHEFTMRKQARIWTDTEISIIREATTLYKDSEYTLDTCFQYAIAKRNVGADKAKELLETPVQPHNSPQDTQGLDTLNVDIQAILEGINDIKDGLTPNDKLIEYQEENRHYIEQIDDLKADLRAANEKIVLLQKDNRRLETESLTLSSEITVIKQMSMWEFRKYKKQYLAQPKESHTHNKNDDIDFMP